jgi:predicted TIM-barrel fold metal-dependent hydrolase
MQLLDFHVHVTPPDISANWRRYAEKEPYFALLSGSPQNRFATAEEVIAALDSSGCDRAVIFGFGFTDMGLCRYVNDYVIEKIRQFPNRLTGFMSVPPGSGELEREIDRCCSAGLRGAGELFPEGQGFDIGEAKDTRSLAGACAERGLPVLVHANEPVGHDYPGKTGVTLKQIERFIEHSPGLTIVLAHWGGGLFFYEAMPELREKCRNVYYDTAATPFLYDRRVYRAASALGLTDKIIFGSDFPLLPLSRYIGAIESSGLGAEEQRRILGANAERLLGGDGGPVLNDAIEHVGKLGGA